MHLGIFPSQGFLFRSRSDQQIRINFKIGKIALSALNQIQLKDVMTHQRVKYISQIMTSFTEAFLLSTLFRDLNEFHQIVYTFL